MASLNHERRDGTGGMHGGADAESVVPAARPVSSGTKAANDAKRDGSVAVRHDPRRYRDIARHAMIPHLAVDRSHVMTEIVTLQQRAPRPFFAVLLPLLFATCCALGVVWPGHGGQLFSIGALPGVWACFVTGSTGSTAAWLVPALAGGLPILWFLGRLLDRLGADPWVWAIALVAGTVLAGYLLLQHYADLEVAVDYHGSFFAFVVCAVQLGSYGATLLALAIGAGRSAGR
jgi:hypothetical protein